MDIVLSHIDALEAMRKPYFPSRLARAELCPTELPRHMPLLGEVREALNVCPQLAGATTPLHVLVDASCHRHVSPVAIAHSCTAELPAGSLVELMPGVRCSSPALLCVQMAPHLTASELTLLLSEMLGTYALSESSDRGMEKRKAPLLTRATLGAYLEKLGRFKGAAIVRDALGRVPECAASPMEAKLFIRATSRFASGGYRLGEVALNDSVRLEALSGEVGELRVRKPDLLLLAPEGRAEAGSFRGVAFDYYGDWHTKPEQVKRDTDRANEFLAHDFKDYVLWKENYDDIDYMDGVMARARRDIGLPERKVSVRRAREERAARDKRIALRVLPFEGAAAFDPRWTSEALGNVVNNAVKYTPAGGAVTLSAQLLDSFCRIDVADTGPGIPEGEQGEIFNRFYRGASTRAAEGLGLGLYLAREILTRQGGYIKVACPPGAGCVFSLYLPRETPRPL